MLPAVLEKTDCLNAVTVSEPLSPDADAESAVPADVGAAAY